MSDLNHFIYQTLDTVGDGSGTKNANVDGSVTAVQFKIVCPAGKRYFINRLIFSLTDTAAGVISSNYGGLGSPLTNGIDFGVYDTDDNVILDLLGGLPIKTNADWSRIGYDLNFLDFGANIGMAARWTFTRDTSRGLVLEPGQTLCVVINDDCEGLITHYFTARGFSIDT